MWKSNVTWSLMIGASLCGLPSKALGQVSGPKTSTAKPAAPQSAAPVAATSTQASAGPAPSNATLAPAPTPPPAPQPPSPPPVAGSPAAPAAQPAPPPAVAVPTAVIPPGYALVPVDNAAQTRYDVEYPQHQGALPPGMELPYEEGEPVPSGYRVVRQPRRGLIIAGSVVGGVAYGLSVVGATGDDFNHKSGALLVPVLGPWIMLALGGAKNECSTTTINGMTYSNTYGCDNSSLRAWLVLDGLTQAAGAAMLTVGIAYPRMRLVRKDVMVSMTPMPLGNHGYGLGAVGSF